MPVSNLFEGDMRIFSIFALTALALPLVRGEVCSFNTTIGITQGPDIFARIGDNVTLTCEVVGNEELSGTRIRWQHPGRNLTGGSSCIYNHSSVPSTCNHTVIDVDLFSKGLYTCRVQVKGDVCSSSAYLTIIPIPMVRVSDPSTGALLDDPRYGPVVVQSGTTRLFECFIQDARPDTYNITWNIANWTEMGTAVVESPFSGGLVNVSSFLLLKHPGDETRESNLTCTATDIHNGKSWNSTSFRITFCRGPGYENTVIGVLINLCVAATIAAVIAEIVIYKHYNG